MTKRKAPTREQLKRLIKRIQSYETGYRDIPLSTLDLLYEAEGMLILIAEVWDNTPALEE